MRVLDDLPPGESPFGPTVVTIGNFDGVHLGHQAILGRVCRRARELGGQAVAVTFDPHPLKLLRPEMELPLLTTPAQKLELLKGCGLDAVVVLPFTREFAALPARDFVSRYFCERLEGAGSGDRPRLLLRARPGRQCRPLQRDGPGLRVHGPGGLGRGE